MEECTADYTYRVSKTLVHLLRIRICVLLTQALVYATPMDDVDTIRDRIVAGCETIRNTPGIHTRIRESMLRHENRVALSDGGYRNVQNLRRPTLHGDVTCTHRSAPRRQRPMTNSLAGPYLRQYLRERRHSYENGFDRKAALEITGKVKEQNFMVSLSKMHEMHFRTDEIKPGPCLASCAERGRSIAISPKQEWLKHCSIKDKRWKFFCGHKLNSLLLKEPHLYIKIIADDLTLQGEHRLEELSHHTTKMNFENEGLPLTSTKMES
ncbi:hypothetical protein PR048_004873 [Dryococelus australis]|uniref:Uncharacterized protein n=1 Tax=Dryococelus australis TaxID=614101 RepID=A0ABQ9I6L9_9NEOP|nr:hypothetical protein PR048_004873 [Dryococelus australis]